MTGYLRRVLSRMSAAAAPGTLQPDAGRRWTSAREPFGIGPALSEPPALSQPPALGEPPATLVTPVTPAAGGDRPAASLPGLPSAPWPASGRAQPAGRIEPVPAGRVEPVPDEPAPSGAPRPRYRRPWPAEPDDRARAGPVTVPPGPALAGYQRMAPVPPAGDGGQPAVTPVAAPAPPRSPGSQFPPRLAAPPHRSAAPDERAAPAAAEMRRLGRPAPERTMLVAPTTRNAPAPPPAIVIGRISVVVDSPRPVAPAAPPRAPARPASAAPVRTTGPRFAHRFGIGQL